MMTTPRFFMQYRSLVENRETSVSKYKFCYEYCLKSYFDSRQRLFLHEEFLIMASMYRQQKMLLLLIWWLMGENRATTRNITLAGSKYFKKKNHFSLFLILRTAAVHVYNNITIKVRSILWKNKMVLFYVPWLKLTQQIPQQSLLKELIISKANEWLFWCC